MGQFRWGSKSIHPEAVGLDARPELRASIEARLVISGRVVTLDKASTVHPKGFVCIEGGTIVTVATDRSSVPADFVGIEPLNTNGTIYPGLIELHNHLAYNMLPLWEVPQRYTNRNVWRNDFAHYLPEVSWPATVLGSNQDLDYQRAIARYVECRSLMGGVTTTQGIAKADGTFYKGLIRNVEFPEDSSWPTAEGQTLDYAPQEVRSKLVPALKADRPFFYHLAEGTDPEARQRFLDLRLDEGNWAINGHLIAIHCVALKPDDFGPLSAAAGMVWSPLSNFLLYGSTADIMSARSHGVNIALGSDWGPSGSKNLLGELKIARVVSDVLGASFSDEDLVRMATTTPAAMLGWDGHVGSVEQGKRADLLILDGAVQDPYGQLVACFENQIMAVVVNGIPRLARRSLLNVEPTTQETVRIGGQPYLLDLAEPTDSSLNGMSLASAIAKLGYGLANMPELARDYADQAYFRLSRAERKDQAPRILSAPADRIEMEFEPDAVGVSRRVDRLAGTSPELEDLRKKSDKAAAIDQTLIRRIALPPLTEIDDPTFRSRVRANINLPAELRVRL